MPRRACRLVGATLLPSTAASNVCGPDLFHRDPGGERIVTGHVDRAAMHSHRQVAGDDAPGRGLRLAKGPNLFLDITNGGVRIQPCLE